MKTHHYVLFILLFVLVVGSTGKSALPATNKKIDFPLSEGISYLDASLNVIVDQNWELVSEEGRSVGREEGQVAITGKSPDGKKVFFIAHFFPRNPKKAYLEITTENGFTVSPEKLVKLVKIEQEKFIIATEKDLKYYSTDFVRIYPKGMTKNKLIYWGKSAKRGLSPAIGMYEFDFNTGKETLLLNKSEASLGPFIQSVDEQGFLFASGSVLYFYSFEFKKKTHISFEFSGALLTKNKVIYRSKWPSRDWFIFDLENHKETLLFSLPERSSALCVFENKIVLSDLSKGTLSIYNMDTKKVEKELNFYVEDNAVLLKDYLIFECQGKEIANLIVYDLKKETSVVLSSWPSGLHMGFDASGEYTTYIKIHPNMPPIIYLYEMKTETTTSFSLFNGSYGNPKIRNNTLFIATAFNKTFFEKSSPNFAIYNIVPKKGN